MNIHMCYRINIFFTIIICAFISQDQTILGFTSNIITNTKHITTKLKINSDTFQIRKLGSSKTSQLDCSATHCQYHSTT